MADRIGNRFNFIATFVVSLGSWSVGYYSNVIGSVLGMPSFYDYFNINVDSSTGVVGAINGSYFGGGILGAVLAAWLCDTAGRRNSMIVTCLIGITGSVLQAASVQISMIMLGRILLGICSGCFQTIVPVYQSEISPPSQRGRMVGAHGFMLCVGASAAVWAGLGCSFARSPQVQWRLTLGLCALPPMALLPMIIWLPESPRWLVMKGKHQQALSTLEKLHRTVDDPIAILPREELLQIHQQIELERSLNFTFFEAFKQRPVRKRLMLGSLLTFILQSTGVLVILNYQVILYDSLNITGWLAICLLAVYTTWSAILNFCNSLWVDKIGRVRLMLYGLAGGAVGLTGFTVMVALFANSTNKLGCAFGVFFMFLYTTFYGSCLDVTGYIYCAEIFPTYMRTSGMAVSIISYYSSALIYGQSAPLAFATIGWKYYLVFIIVPLLGLGIIWMYFPETKGLSLEEISGLFGDTVALDLHHLTTEERQKLEEKVSQKFLDAGSIQLAFVQHVEGEL